MKIMKKFVILVLAFGFVFYMTNTATYAQGKGQQGRGPAVNPDQGRQRPEPPSVQRRDDRHDQKRDLKHDTATRHENHEVKFQDRLEQNPKLSAKLHDLLPAGTNLQTAAAGFKNQGQFIAAVHVSKNLGISFDQLKLKMTGPDAMSLGQAIQDFKPNSTERDIRREVERAEKQAKETEKSGTT